MGWGLAYLAFDLDALKRVPDAARAAGLPEEAVGYGLVRLWSHCWNEKTETVTFTHLRGFFGGEPSSTAAALVAFRFVEPISDNTYRVRGVDRYLRLSKARSAGGKMAAGNLKQNRKPAGSQPELTTGYSSGYSSGSSPADLRLQPVVSSGSAPALTPSTEHRAPSTESKTTTLSAAADRGPVPADLQAVWNDAAPKGLPRWKATPDDRKRHAKARLAEVPDLERWRVAIKAIASSKWHMGQNDRGWRANPDWLLKPGTLTKLEEGGHGGSADWRLNQDYGEPAEGELVF